MSKAGYKALKKLKPDDFIKILPADKDNAIVINGVIMYNDKIKDVLTVRQFRELKKGLKSSVQSKISTKIQR